MLWILFEEEFNKDSKYICFQWIRCHIAEICIKSRAYRCVQNQWEYVMLKGAMVLQNGYFSEGCNFRNLSIWVFKKGEFSEFAHVEFLPILIKVNSEERLTQRGSQHQNPISEAGVFAKQHYHYFNENMPCCHCRVRVHGCCSVKPIV